MLEMLRSGKLILWLMVALIAEQRYYLSKHKESAVWTATKEHAEEILKEIANLGKDLTKNQKGLANVQTALREIQSNARSDARGAVKLKDFSEQVTSWRNAIAQQSLQGVNITASLGAMNRRLVQAMDSLAGVQTQSRRALKQHVFNAMMANLKRQHQLQVLHTRPRLRVVDLNIAHMWKILDGVQQVSKGLQEQTANLTEANRKQLSQGTQSSSEMMRSLSPINDTLLKMNETLGAVQQNVWQVFQILSVLKSFHLQTNKHLAPTIKVRTSVSECVDRAGDASLCDLPVSTSRKTVTVNTACGVPHLRKGVTEINPGSDQPHLAGPNDIVDLAHGVKMTCSRAASQNANHTCTLENLSKVKATYRIDFNCSWNNIISKKTVVVKVDQPLVVGIDIGTKNTRAWFYDENRKLRQIRLSNLPSGFFPSTLAVCPDRHIFGASVQLHGTSLDNCSFIHDTKVLLGEYSKLYDQDFRLMKEDNRSAEIYARCSPSAASSKKCKLTVARWKCAHDNARTEHQAINMTTIMAGLIKNITSQIQHQLGGGFFYSVYTSPFVFPQHQSKALFDAIRIAGTDSTNMLLHIPETVAAAAYYLSKINKPKGRLFLSVLDFGHGTSSINFLIKTPTYGLRIARGGGLPNVGGRQYDLCLANELSQITKRPVSPQEAERIKIQVNNNGVMSVDGFEVDLDLLNKTFYKKLEQHLRRELEKVFRLSANCGENVCFSCKDFQSENGMVLVVGGMAKLRCVRDYLTSFFKAKCNPDQPSIIVKFAADDDLNDNDYSSQSVVSKGAALLGALHLQHLPQNVLNFALQPLDEKTFMSLRVRGIVGGAETCISLIQSPARAADRPTHATVEYNTIWDEKKGQAYIDMQGILCQSTDTFSRTTDCNSCRGEVDLENPVVWVDKHYNGTVKLRVRASRETNGPLILNVLVVDKYGQELSERNFSSKILSFEDGHYKEEEIQWHQKMGKKMMDTTSYAACSMFNSSDVAEDDSSPALELHALCCTDFPCSSASSTGNNDPNEKNSIVILPGRSLFCQLEISRGRTRMLDPPSDLAIIVDERVNNPELSEAVVTLLTQLNATVNMYANANIQLMYLALRRNKTAAGEGLSDAIVQVQLPRAKMRSLNFGEPFNRMLAGIGQPHNDVEANLEDALRAAATKVCNVFQEGERKLVNVVVVLQLPVAGTTLLKHLHSIWADTWDCLESPQFRANLWTLFVAEKNPSIDLDSFGEDIFASNKLQLASKSVTIVTSEHLKTELGRLLHLSVGNPAWNVSVEVNVEGAGYMACMSAMHKSSELIAFERSLPNGNRPAGAVSPSEWVGFKIVALFDETLIPVRCLVGSEFPGIFQVSATLHWNDIFGNPGKSATHKMIRPNTALEEIEQIRAHQYALNGQRQIPWSEPFLSGVQKLDYGLKMDVLWLFDDFGFDKEKDKSWCETLGWTRDGVHEALTSMGYPFHLSGKIVCDLRLLNVTLQQPVSMVAFSFTGEYKRAHHLIRKMLSTQEGVVESAETAPVRFALTALASNNVSRLFQVDLDLIASSVN